MLANINGVQHRLRFNHKMLFKEVARPGGTRKVQIPFTVKVPLSFSAHTGTVAASPAHISKARAVTTCRVLTGKKPDVTVVAEGVAVCSWSEKSFDKEFARQLALARVIKQLPREFGARLLGAYMESGPRTLCNLGPATRGEMVSLSDALPKPKPMGIAGTLGAPVESSTRSDTPWPIDSHT